MIVFDLNIQHLKLEVDELSSRASQIDRKNHADCDDGRFKFSHKSALAGDLGLGIIIEKHFGDDADDQRHKNSKVIILETVEVELAEIEHILNDGISLGKRFSAEVYPGNEHRNHRDHVGEELSD